MSTLHRHYFSTVTANGVILLLGVISGVLAARLLGPEGRGELAIVTLWPLNLGLVGSLGLNQAVTYFSAKEPEQRAAVWTLALSLAAAQSIVLFGAGYFALPFLLRSQPVEVVRLARFFLVYLPIGFASAYFQNMLQGALQIREFNLTRTVNAGTYTVGVLGLFLLHLDSVRLVALALLSSYLMGAGLGLAFIRKKVRPHWQWNPRLLADMLKYGLHAYAGYLAQVLHPQVVLLVMTVFLPAAAIGYYAVGYTLGTGLLIIPAGVGAVTLAKGAQSSATEARQILRHSLRITLGLMVPCAGILYFAAPVLLRLFFGTEFLPSVSVTRILLLAILPLAATQVLYEGLRALNHPQGAGYAGLAGILAAVPLLWLLLPRQGPLGAAAAFATSCFVALGVALWYAQRRAAFPLQTLLRSSWGAGAADALAGPSLAEAAPTHVREDG